MSKINQRQNGNWVTQGSDQSYLCVAIISGDETESNTSDTVWPHFLFWVQERAAPRNNETYLNMPVLYEQDCAYLGLL